MNCEMTVTLAVAGKSDPDGSAVGAATASRRQDIRHEGCPVSQAYSQGSVFDHPREGCHDDRRPLLTSTAATGIPVRSTKARIAANPVTPMTDTRRPKAPFHRQVSTRAGWTRRPTHSRTSRHRTPALPPRTRLPAGVHDSTLESLGLRAPRLFTGCPRPPAARRLLQQNVTRARHRFRPTSNRPHSKLRDCRMTFTTRVKPAGLPQARGPMAEHAARPPPARPLAWVDLPQPDRPERPMSPARAAPRLDCSEKQRSCGCGSRIERVGLANRASPARREGCLPNALAKERAKRDTRSAFHHTARRLGRQWP